MNKKPLTIKKIFNLLNKVGKLKLGIEKLDLDQSLGRFLGVDLISKINLPPFSNSAVDGYALLKNDLTKKNIYFNLSHRVAAGDDILSKIKKGEVVRIFTGAPMPTNSKTVVMQENVTTQNNKIKIINMPQYGENCRIAGEDIRSGQKILLNGALINAQNINLIAAIGKKNVLVQKKIKVGFYTSGNELVHPCESLKGSQINNSNYYSLNALLDRPYIKKSYLGLLRDDEISIEKSILKNIKNQDVIITTGGASVGEEDYLVNTLNKFGKIFFWKTAIKPGRPLAIGRIDKTIIICLPGNPVSVHLLYAMIVKPFLEYLCSGKLIKPKGIKVKTNFTMKKKNKRLEWLRVNVVEKNKTLFATKYPKQGSGMISSISFSDGIIEIPEKISFISRNDIFDYYSFETLFN